MHIEQVPWTAPAAAFCLQCCQYTIYYVVHTGTGAAGSFNFAGRDEAVLL
jgi:hypothetical protein